MKKDVNEDLDGAKSKTLWDSTCVLRINVIDYIYGKYSIGKKGPRN